MERVIVNMEYREIYKALERRWQSVPGMRFVDFSRWRGNGQRRLLLVIEDQSVMRRYCVSQEDGAILIVHVQLDEHGKPCGKGARYCENQAKAARELERLFVRLDLAA